MPLRLLRSEGGAQAPQAPVRAGQPMACRRPSPALATIASWTEVLAAAGNRRVTTEPAAIATPKANLVSNSGGRIQIDLDKKLRH